MAFRPPTQPTLARKKKSAATAEDSLSLREKMLALLQSDPFINAVVAIAITVGFIHGWLKIKLPYAITTFAFDALLGFALMLVYFQHKKKGSFMPSGPVGQALMVFYAICGIYLLLPTGVPFIIGLAAARGWCFATLMFALGYHLTKSVDQVKGYFYVLIFIGLGTAFYGLQQTPQEVEEEMRENEMFAERYKFTYYATEKGKQLRIFSTFVSSGAFGGTMAYVSIFALALATDKKTGKKERILLFLLTFPIAYAMLKSGARSSLITFGVGFAVIAWYRRNLTNLIVLPLAVAMIIKLVAINTGGSSAERFASLLKYQEVLGRIVIPTQAGWEYMSDGNWFGGGIGRSSHSVPLFLSIRIQFHGYVLADGDLGRLMIEMGIIGMAAFGFVMFRCLRMVYDSLNELRDTPISSIVLASGACVVMAAISIPSGSPFLGIPMGALTWFFIGTLQKLADEYRQGKLLGLSTATGTAEPKPAKRFLTRRN
jgi:hypothetical protein